VGNNVSDITVSIWTGGELAVNVLVLLGCVKASGVFYCKGVGEFSALFYFFEVFYELSVFLIWGFKWGLEFFGGCCSFGTRLFGAR
jgi:hypothetical protein